MRKTTPNSRKSYRYYALNVISTVALFASMAILPAQSPTQPEPAAPATPAVEWPSSLARDGLGTVPQPASTPAPVTAKLATAATPAKPATVASSGAKFPGLPDYPHPQYEYRTVAMPAGPLYPMEPFLGRISAEDGWDAAASSNPAPTIAVIDTGFSLYHDNLVDRWALNSSEIEGSTVDNDSDGYAGNWRGWDFVHDTPNPAAGVDYPASSSAGHGTLTAGLAGLLDAEATLMPLQALDDTGSGYTDAVAAAVRYAADHDAKIISLSLGTMYDDAYLRSQISYAISKGSLVIAAAGNNGCNCMLYPAAYPEVLAVGASTSSDVAASFSSYGANLDVLAPGTAGDVCSSNYTWDPLESTCRHASLSIL